MTSYIWPVERHELGTHSFQSYMFLHHKTVQLFAGVLTEICVPLVKEILPSYCMYISACISPVITDAPWIQETVWIMFSSEYCTPYLNEAWRMLAPWKRSFKPFHIRSKPCLHTFFWTDSKATRCRWVWPKLTWVVEINDGGRLSSYCTTFSFPL